MMDENEKFELIATAFYRETGYMRPGKDDPRGIHSDDDRDIRFRAWSHGLFPLDLKAQVEKLKASRNLRIERLRDALAELIEVADLRGDSNIPHPCDDPKLWSARMADAWSEARAVLADAQPDSAEEIFDAELHKLVAKIVAGIRARMQAALEARE